MASDETIRVCEIFRSIQGEGTRAGLPCKFVRLAGCNLRCTYCDTLYAVTSEGEPLSVEDVAARLADMPGDLCCVTGGEPLLQPGCVPLCERLLDAGQTVLVETNGSLDVSVLPEGAVRIVDVKCPGSGECGSFLPANCNCLRSTDEVKFVLKDRADYDWACDAIRDRGLDLQVRDGMLRALIFSPVWDELELSALSEWMLEDDLPVRLQIQLHKLIWDPGARGV